MSTNLKNKLDQEPLEFDTSAAWKQLSPKLEAKKRKRRGLIWWWVGGSASMLLIALVTFNFYTQTSEEQAQFAPEAIKEKSYSDATTMRIEEFNNKALKSEIGVASVDLTSEPNLSRDSTIQRTTSLSRIEPEENPSFPLMESKGSLASERIDDGKISIAQFEERRSNQRQELADKSSLQIFYDSPIAKKVEKASSSSSLDSSQIFSDNHVVVENRIDSDVLNKVSVLELALFELQVDTPLGPLPIVETKPPSQPVKLSTKPYWQVGVLAGIGYEQLRPNDRVSEVSGRTTLETRSLQFAIRRSLSKRFAISTNVQIMQRHELYRTDLTERFFETVYNSTALVVGGERFGDSVLVVPRQRIQSDRYATFTRTNIGIVGEYLFSTRFCEYAMYGGLNIAVSQKWNGSRMVQRELPGFSIWEGVNPIIEDRRGPYNSIGTVSGLFSYVLGARASKPIGGQFRILLDGRLVLDSDYSIESAYREIFTETGNSVSLSLGLGWRFN